VEFSVASVIGSVSLFADSIDFLEHASDNLLIAIAFGWSACAVPFSQRQCHAGGLSLRTQ
jgi:Co/Zn/Cd efflux system component